MADSRESAASSDWVGSPVYKRAFRKSLLSREEEIDLIQRAQAGDRQASSELVERNIRFVQSIAKHYRVKGVIEMEDLIQEGVFGLLRAIRKFDCERGNKLSTYAAWWIRSYCGRAQLAAALVSPGADVDVRSIRSRFDDMVRDMTHELQREPTNVEVAEQLGVPVEVVDRFRACRAKYLSLEDFVVTANDGDASSVIWKDQVIDPNPLADVTSEKADSARRLSELLEGLCARLIPREAKVIRRRFLNEKKETLEEIGTDFDVSRERIRQIQNEALRKLRIRICSSKGLEEECRDLLASLNDDDRGGHRSVLQCDPTREKI